MEPGLQRNCRLRVLFPEFTQNAPADNPHTEIISYSYQNGNSDPCIKGTRIPVAMVVGSLADGMLLRPDQGGIRPTVELIERVLQSYDRNA